MNGIFYYDKFVQPSSNPCVGNILQSFHGEITAETLYRDVAGYHSTGDTQVAVMDPAGEQIWVSWSAYKTNQKAYTRSMLHIKLSDFWTHEQDDLIQ